MLYRFDDFLLDPGRRELWRGASAIEVGPQVFDLLTYLVQNRERVVSQDDLLAAIWKGRIVSESTMRSHINAVRTAVGDNGEDQRLIRTLPRKGFRFVGAITETDALVPPAGGDITATQPEPPVEPNEFVPQPPMRSGASDAPGARTPGPSTPEPANHRAARRTRRAAAFASPRENSGCWSGSRGGRVPRRDRCFLLASRCGASARNVARRG